LKTSSRQVEKRIEDNPDQQRIAKLIRTPGREPIAPPALFDAGGETPGVEVSKRKCCICRSGGVTLYDHRRRGRFSSAPSRDRIAFVEAHGAAPPVSAREGQEHRKSCRKLTGIFSPLDANIAQSMATNIKTVASEIRQEDVRETLGRYRVFTKFALNYVVLDQRPAGAPRDRAKGSGRIRCNSLWPLGKQQLPLFRGEEAHKVVKCFESAAQEIQSKAGDRLYG
jgi:hypothetical protein